MRRALKWIGYTILGLIVATVVTVAILLNSTNTIEWAVNRYAPEYGFEYKKISGGLLTGLDVDGVTFKGDDLLEKLKLRWNPATLLEKEVSLASLSVSGIDISTTEKVVKAFSSDSNPKDENSSFALPVSIWLGKLHLSAKPFVHSGISFEQLNIDGKRLYLDSNSLAIGDLLLSSEANLSAQYESVDIKSAKINLSDADITISDLVAKSAKVDIDILTSLATLQQKGTVENNRFISKGHIVPLKELFRRYDIPLRADAFENISLSVDADQNRAKLDIALDADDILNASSGDFNINKLHLKSQVAYLVAEEIVSVDSIVNLSTPYTHSLTATNRLKYENSLLIYEGEVNPGVLQGIEGNYTKPIRDLKINYEGDDKSIVAMIDAKNLKGQFISKDFKKAELNLSTKEALVLKDMVSLPTKLQEAKATFDIHIPLNLEQITPLDAKAKIDSNIANLDADILYDKELKVSTKASFPKDSLLRDFSKELNLDALNPLTADTTLNGNSLGIEIKSDGLNSKAKYALDDQNITGNMVLGGANFIFDGNLESQVSLKSSSGSLHELLNKFKTIYAFEPPPIDGDIDLLLMLKDKKDIELLVNSDRLLYKSDRKTEYTIYNTMISLGFSDEVLKLNRYHATIQDVKIFSTKPSTVSFKEDNIEISPLWVNDELKVTGKYSTKDQKGEIVAYANPLKLTDKMIDLSSNIDIKTKLDGNSTLIKGSVIILDGEARFELAQSGFASDSDIIIVQDMKKVKPSPLYDNLVASIKLKTQKAILYKTEDANIKLRADLAIEKASMGPAFILGTTSIEQGSTYSFQNKKFGFKKGLIAFTGDPDKPILDISAVYNSVNYEITIQVTGTPATPNIIFSSVPSLTREQILSVILFDNEDAGDGSSGDEMMRMMGGAMAKSVLANMGIKIDHLSLGTDGTMEIGKRVSDKVTIIYVEDEVSGVKLQYDYSRYIKASIISDPQSSGADIIYKRDYEKLPLIGQ